MKLKKGNFKISYIGSDFRNWFGEPDVTSKKWDIFKFILPVSMDDKEILEKYKPSEISLDDLAYILELEKSPMLVNGYANIFYVRDQTGVLRAVRVHWYGDGWNVYASSVEDPYRWRDGHQVFSRNSVLGFSGTPQQALGNSDALTLESAIKLVKENGYKIYKEI